MRSFRDLNALLSFNIGEGGCKMGIFWQCLVCVIRLFCSASRDTGFQQGMEKEGAQLPYFDCFLYNKEKAEQYLPHSSHSLKREILLDSSCSSEGGRRYLGSFTERKRKGPDRQKEVVNMSAIFWKISCHNANSHTSLQGNTCFSSFRSIRYRTQVRRTYLYVK